MKAEPDRIFRSPDTACEYANFLNQRAVGYGGLHKYMYVASRVHCVVTRFVLNEYGWRDTGLVEAPITHYDKPCRKF